MGIYDENELFDALLLKRNEAVPNSIINPFGVGEYEGHNDSETYCYDFYGYPTKNVLGQRTCLLAVEMSQEKKYIYSGPLMGKAMIMDSMAFCYSFVNDSILYGKDYCFTRISLESVKLQCCCAHEPHLCSPKEIEIIEYAEYKYDVDQKTLPLQIIFK
uniref:Uncharacterized protein n=1 Tax=Panagrolaimus superbus TaxID=310955 RepID=A0A914YU47_9BILA